MELHYRVGVSEILFSRIRFNKKSCNSLRSLCLCFALSYFSTRFKNYMPNRLLSRCYATLPPASPSEPRGLGHNPSEQLLTVIVRPPLKHSLQSPDSRLQSPECVLSTTGSCFRSAVRSIVQSLFPNALTIGGRIFGHYPSST
jgi:hypothetical protein